MRGLTQAERHQLQDDSLSEASAREHEIWERLVSQGRVRVVPFDDEFDRWVSTDMGALALRCCPVKEQ